MQGSSAPIGNALSKAAFNHFVNKKRCRLSNQRLDSPRRQQGTLCLVLCASCRQFLATCVMRERGDEEPGLVLTASLWASRFGTPMKSLHHDGDSPHFDDVPAQCVSEWRVTVAEIAERGVYGLDGRRGCGVFGFQPNRWTAGENVEEEGGEEPNGAAKEVARPIEVGGWRRLDGVGLRGMGSVHADRVRVLVRLGKDREG